jgi:hypothetical protein
MAVILVRDVISTLGLEYLISLGKPFKMKGHSIGVYINYKFGAAPFWRCGPSWAFDEKVYFLFWYVPSFVFLQQRIKKLTVGVQTFAYPCCISVKV